MLVFAKGDLKVEVFIVPGFLDGAKGEGIKVISAQ